MKITKKPRPLNPKFLCLSYDVKRNMLTCIDLYYGDEYDIGTGIFGQVISQPKRIEHGFWKSCVLINGVEVEEVFETREQARAFNRIVRNRFWNKMKSAA